MLTGKRIGTMVFALLILTGLAVGGVVIYKAGFTHGAMTNITLPEGSNVPLVPFGYMPYGWPIGPRAGLLVLFPMLCFGGFFFLALIFGLGFITRKRAWMHQQGPGSHPNYWKQHGPPLWGSSKSSRAADQPEASGGASPDATDQTEG